MRYTANAPARPRSDSTQFFNCMDNIVFPAGESLSSIKGEYLFSPLGFPIATMKTVEETRRIRLRILVEKLSGMANLCEALGYARNETATLTRILNANIRHDRDGKPYNMGGPMAREIELKLELQIGWMDTPPTHAELHGESDPRAMAMAVLESLPQEDWAAAVRLLAALQEPAAPAKNGTDH